MRRAIQFRCSAVTSVIPICETAVQLRFRGFRVAMRRIEAGEPADLTAEAERARFRLEVALQRVRITKEDLRYARDQHREARREAKRARRKWRSLRKQIGRGAARAVKRKAKQSVRAGRVLTRARAPGSTVRR